MATRWDWEERLSALEDRLADVEAARSRPLVEADLSDAELVRAGKWLALCRSLDGEPLTSDNAHQRHLDELTASEEARWLHCRLQHGPGLCEIDCRGEFRHRQGWHPSAAKPTPAQSVQPAEAPSRRDIFSPTWMPFGGAGSQQTRVPADWT